MSVLIPVYNAERYVSAAIDSVLRQDYTNLEVIAVNDGSTDTSREKLAKFDGRITVIDQDNRGQCAAANRAFMSANGQLIKFFDADDIMTPSMISLQVSRIGRRRDVVAMGEWTRFYGDKPANEKFDDLSMYCDAHPVDWLVSEWSGARPMMQCGLWLIPREIIKQAGLWNEKLSLINDFEYFTRILTAANEILYSPGARLYYRSGVGGSLSGQKSRKSIESQYLSLMLGTQHLLSIENSPRTRRACANILKDFDYDHYPAHADLRAKVRARVAELGGADLEPTGPPGFHRLRGVVGWKLARRVQKLIRG